MDEGMLNDLLECSVCLERLDTSSKVLPCQHTFCKKCLEGIVERHKELRCPECRVLVPCKIEELPPNVLLMRILEGMRNAVPKKQQQRLIRVVNHATPVHHHSPDQHRHVGNKQVLQHHVQQSHQPYAKALYDYSSKEPGDLNFKRGDIIILRKRIDNNWYQGECNGNQGFFPLSYVQVITPLPSNVPQCKALYDFRMTNDDEEGCLTFNKGDIITVIRRVDENWAEGKLDDRIGIFPLAFVELNNLARSLMKLSTNSQPGPSRLAPPTPTSEDITPLIPTDHTRTVQVTHRTVQSTTPHQPAPLQTGLPTSDSSSTVSSGNSSSTTPNTSSGGTSSSSSTAPSSPASPPNRTQPPPSKPSTKPDLVPTSTASISPRVSNNATFSSQQTEPHQSHHNREKRHSFTSVTASHHQATNHRHSAEILSSEIEPQSQANGQPQPQSSDHGRRTGNSELNPNNLQLPAAYVALYPYKPQKADELELRKGGIYIVTERCQDGWFKGTSNRTQKCGVFPGNYVTLARGAPRSPQPSPRSGENSSENKSVVSYTRSGKPRQSANCLPPDLPPRSSSPAIATNTISSSWHGQQDNAATPLGRSSSAIMSVVANSPHTPTNGATVGKLFDKQKERKEKGTVSLMRRLTSIKRSKSPPASSYMDNPVFEDSTVSVTTSHPIHVRSGSCPSQLLQVLPAEHHRKFVSTSQRLKHKDRPSVFAHSSRTGENMAGSSASSPDVHHHRKSNSLDAGNRTKTGTQTVRERFRCIAPYPPNSEYELELQVNDIIYVHKKRDDGWYKGTQQRTGRTGLFPASFVESF